jgi:hypothetical protein
LTTFLVARRRAIVEHADKAHAEAFRFLELAHDRVGERPRTGDRHGASVPSLRAQPA